jgi:hypothetical protein
MVIIHVGTAVCRWRAKTRVECLWGELIAEINKQSGGGCYPKNLYL